MMEHGSIVRRVEARRTEVGMTVRTLAMRAGVKESSLYRVLTGHRKMTASELVAVSFVLGMRLEDFV